MSLVVLYAVPALIGLVAAWVARSQRPLAARIGLAALLALPAVVGWHGVVLAARGHGGVMLALWAVVWSAPAWGLAVLLGALMMRRGW